MNWETLYTQKIKTILVSHARAENDYGTRIRIKCHQRIERNAKTIESELCTNWGLLDSFGVQLTKDFDVISTPQMARYSGSYSDQSIVNMDDLVENTVCRTDVHKNFYTDPSFTSTPASWLQKYTTVNHGSLRGEKGFMLQNGIFDRFAPIGITWKDSYCRRIADAGPSGCFVKRDLSASADFDNQENNCTGKDSTNLLR